MRESEEDSERREEAKRTEERGRAATRKRPGQLMQSHSVAGGSNRAGITFGLGLEYLWASHKRRSIKGGQMSWSPSKVPMAYISNTCSQVVKWGVNAIF